MVVPIFFDTPTDEKNMDNTINISILDLYSSPPYIVAFNIDTILTKIKALPHDQRMCYESSIRLIIDWLTRPTIDGYRLKCWMGMVGMPLYPKFIDRKDIVGDDRIIKAMYPDAYWEERNAINSLFARKYNEVEHYVRHGNRSINALMSAAYYYGDVRGFGLCRLTRKDGEVNYRAAGFLNKLMRDGDPLPSPEMVHAAVTPEMIPFIDDTTSDVCCVVYEFIANIISLYDAAMIDHYIHGHSSNLFVITMTATDIAWRDVRGLPEGAMYIVSRGYPISVNMVKRIYQGGLIEYIIIPRGIRLTEGVIHKQSALAGVRRCSDVYRAIECVTARNDGYVRVREVHEMYMRLRMPVPRERRDTFSDVLIVVAE